MSKLTKSYLLAKKCSNPDCRVFMKNTLKKNCPYCKSRLEDFYDLLNFFSLKKDFTSKELQSAFKKLSLFLHPDVKQDSGEDFIFLKEAHETLKKNKPNYLNDLARFEEALAAKEVIDEKESENEAQDLASEEASKPASAPETKETKQESEKPTSSGGWIRNNKFQFINIFSGFLFGLLLVALSLFFFKNAFLAFSLFCFSLALGGVWQKAVFFYAILFELLLIIFFSWFIYQQYFFLAFLVLPLFYFSFKFLKNIVGFLN